MNHDTFIKLSDSVIKLEYIFMTGPDFTAVVEVKESKTLLAKHLTV